MVCSPDPLNQKLRVWSPANVLEQTFQVILMGVKGGALLCITTAHEDSKRIRAAPRMAKFPVPNP